MRRRDTIPPRRLRLSPPVPISSAETDTRAATIQRGEQEQGKTASMMMQGIRKASQGFLGKLLVSVMFGVLILAFAIWGVGDIFRGYGRNEVARVGKSEIGLEQMRTAYQNEIQNLTRQQRRQISPEMARALGLDVGPMSGFDRAKVDQAFFADTNWHADLLINLGYADPSKTFERLPRLSFEEACRFA